MEKKRWSDLNKHEKAALLGLASLQASLAVSAWTDLAVRKSEQVRGSKVKWAAIIAVNFVGPVLYYSRGRITS
ncbi:hypothetical protein ATJ97_2065 [Georgenia soli]|uniref:Phospholipase D-like protein n=1 Tax=Georgenia soli TaxID=638953 RepID=A0A2A9EMT3_9MICO|nr:hypothetical protein [Georgenia soli]PFG39555.1 hypothetical protein ATJ97_2065 [Georgenia soli]